MNGDGVADIVVGLASVVLYTYNGTSWTETVVASGMASPFGVRLGDVDGDNDTDIAISWAGSSAFVWYENDGGTPVPSFVVHVVNTTS